MSGLSVRATIAARGVDVDLEVAAGEVLALVGANGSGKTTVLHTVAGLLAPDSGVVRVGGRTVTDTAAGVAVAPHARRVGLLWQDALLFPHLRAAGNVAFAARAAGRGSRAARAAARRWLEEVGVAALADRRPRALSGGQAQRVALARALAAEPDVLLLDEPLAGLDVSAASAMRTVLRRVMARDGRAAVIVTHDLLDVVTLADRVAVLADGAVVEIGPVPEVLAGPRSRFAARLAGLNMVAGVIDDGAVRTAWGSRLGAGSPLRSGAHAVAVFSPGAVGVAPPSRDPAAADPTVAGPVVADHAPAGGGSTATLGVEVADLEPVGSAIRIRGATQPDGGAGLMADLPAVVVAERGVGIGSPLVLTVAAHAVTVLSAAEDAPDAPSPPGVDRGAR